MPPIPAPIEDEIEKVREIVRIKDYTTVAAAVNLLNNSAWANTLDDVDEWSVIRDDYTEIEKGLLGANISPAMQRLAITNRVRERLGFDPVNENGTAVIYANSNYSESIAVAGIF